MTWVLILSYLTQNAVAVREIEFTSLERCRAAAEMWKKAEETNRDGNHDWYRRYKSAICVQR